MTVSEQPIPRSPEKVRPTAAKRISRKKSKDKPKRPLSAYNFFFREEREKILQIIRAEDTNAIQPDPDADDYLTDEQICRLKKNGDKISFEEMGKLIGIRWKNIDPDRLSRFSELASKDTERYKKEMVAFNSRQEEKLRNDALKSPLEASAYASASNYAEHEMGAAPGTYTAEQQVYAAQMASRSYSAYNGGMMYSGYSMPMYSHGSYIGPAGSPDALLRAGFDNFASAQQQQYLGAYSAGNSIMGYSQSDQQGNLGSEHNQTGETHGADGSALDPRTIGSYYHTQSNTWGHH